MKAQGVDTMFGEMLKKLRTEKGLSQEDLALIIGVSKSTIGMYETSNRMPKADTTLKKIAQFFNVTIDYLVGLSDENLHSPYTTEEYITYPVIGEIAAGYDNIAEENWNGDFIEVPISYLSGRDKSEYFVLRVKGNSMFPTYQDGDKVLILKQSTLDYSGQIGAILYDDECASLKKVESKTGEDWLRLIPINPSFPPIKIENERLEGCRVLGIPKMLIREIKE